MVSLTAIVAEIERRAKTREIGRLQEIRKRLKGKVSLPSQIFNAKTTFEKGDFTYAFHYGGRKELQFNIGFEPGNRFRHGVAFSFEPNQTLPNPEEVLIPRVRRFNEFLTLYPQRFSGMLMWYWLKNGRSESDHYPAPIAPDLMSRGVFAFMGKMQPSNAIDYDAILDDFDRLLPLYHFVEGKGTFPEVTEPTKHGFQFKSGCTIKASVANASRAERQLNINLRHNEIQQALHDHLASLLGPDDVGTELYSAGGQVDVVVRRGDRFWFYEIKTAMSARGCVREALAQLLEYSFWPGAQVAERLTVIGEPAFDSESERYLATLRERFSLPIEYQQFDVGTGALVTRSE